jgi:hypothetical protein
MTTMRHSCRTYWTSSIQKSIWRTVQGKICETWLSAHVLSVSFGVSLLRLATLLATGLGTFVSAGVLGASLLSFDKLKMLMLLDCQESEVIIPLLGIQMRVAMAHNLTMLAAICSSLLLSVSSLALGYLVGRSRS